jgi:hypothetical protein
MMEFSIGSLSVSISISAVMQSALTGGIIGSVTNVFVSSLMSGGNYSLRQLGWDAMTGFGLGALSGGTYSVFHQAGRSVAKNFLGKFGIQLGLRLLFSAGSFSTTALYDTLYDAWMIKREVGNWPSGSQFMTLYKFNIAINCIGFGIDATQIGLTTMVDSAIGDLGSAKSRANYRSVYSSLTKDRKMLNRGAAKIIKAFDSNMAAAVSVLSANVAQKLAKEEWEGEMDLDN